MKSFYYDSEENVFGIKDDEKFKVIRFNVHKCTITGNKAVVYSDSGISTYKLLPNGEYTLESIN